MLRQGDITDPVSNGVGNAHVYSEEGHIVNHVANVNADFSRGPCLGSGGDTLIPSSMVLSVPCRSGADHAC